MGIFANIKNSIDDKSSMSVNSITLLVSAMMGVIVGLVLCFVLIWDVVYDGVVDTPLDDLGIFLLCSGGYIMGSGIPKAWVDSRMKFRSWVEGEKMRIDAEEEVDGYGEERHRRRRMRDDVDVVDGDDGDA